MMLLSLLPPLLLLLGPASAAGSVLEGLLLLVLHPHMDCHLLWLLVVCWHEDEGEQDAAAPGGAGQRAAAKCCRDACRDRDAARHEQLACLRHQLLCMMTGDRLCYATVARLVSPAVLPVAWEQVCWTVINGILLLLVWDLFPLVLFLF